jgi:hypothetical protein
MSTETFLIAVVFFLVLAVLRMRLKLKIKEVEKSIERNKAVFWFRHCCLKLRPDLYEKLPSYSEMLESDVRIEIESYFPEEKYKL